MFREILPYILFLFALKVSHTYIRHIIRHKTQQKFADLVWDIKEKKDYNYKFYLNGLVRADISYIYIPTKKEFMEKYYVEDVDMLRKCIMLRTR